MRNKLTIFLSILFLYTSNVFPLFSYEEIKKKEIQSINLNYLENLPTNDYIIGPGDNLQIIISRFYPELTSNVLIDGEGTIRLPKLNRVFVDGLNLTELKEVLNNAYLQYVKYPSIEIDIVRYRPIKVFVDGQVENPGNHVLKGSYSTTNISNLYNNLQPIPNTQSNLKGNSFSDLNVSRDYFPTVFDAIRASGGITQFADLSNVTVVRRNNLSNGGGKISTSINLEETLINGDTSQNIRIYDSDVIKISKSSLSNKEILQRSILSKITPRFSRVFVSGRVNKPGYITISKSGSLNEAIEMAGGTKALKGPTTFIRFNNNGTIDKRKFKLSQRNKRGSYKNPYLKTGDLIIVGNSLFSTSSEIINEFTKPFVGVFSTYALIKAINE